MDEKGLFSIEELDERKKQVASRLVQKFVESGMGLMYQDPEYDKLPLNMKPILHAWISFGDRVLDIVNLHLKSRLPSDIEGQKLDRYTWRTASGWAEGFFVSSMKRVGQALEARTLFDKLFDTDEDAWIVVCGDFNADFDEVPVEAIRGMVEDTGNCGLAKRVMLPCEMSISESTPFSLYHRGRGRMLDHLLVSRSMLSHYKGSEVHNELLHDESVAFATETKFPEPEHAPVVAKFELPG